MNNNNKEEYYKLIRELHKEGLVTEIFYDDYLSILNIADRFYMINFIEENNKKDSDIVGLIGNYEMIDYVSDGLIYYYKQLKALGDDAQILILDQSTIEKIRKLKVNSIKNGPTKHINKETEIELMRKVNARVAENKVSDSMKTKAKSEPSEEKGFWEKVIDLFK